MDYTSAQHPTIETFEPAIDNADKTIIHKPVPKPYGQKPKRSSVLPPWQLIKLSKFEDPRGNLSVIESDVDIPFEIKRVFYLYDVPGGASRAGHANKTCHQFLIAMSGSFDVHLDNGDMRQSFHLNRSYQGLYIPPMTWRDIDNFSSGAVCMALASHPYNEGEYHREYRDFIDAVKAT